MLCIRNIHIRHMYARLVPKTRLPSQLLALQLPRTSMLRVYGAGAQTKFMTLGYSKLAVGDFISCRRHLALPSIVLKLCVCVGGWWLKVSCASTLSRLQTQLKDAGVSHHCGLSTQVSLSRIFLHDSATWPSCLGSLTTWLNRKCDVF